MPTLLARADDLAGTIARLDALTNWENRPRNPMRVGLEPIADLMARLGDPHKAFRAIHVAGTKGKGSVAALIEAALVRAGLAVGRYGSPHVERVNERVSLGCRDVDDSTLAAALARALDAYEAARGEHTAATDATWFDLLTSAAFLIFRDCDVRFAAVEVGLGGRLDSTNVADGEVAVLTNVELEHTEVLGATRAAIAREKAGIIKPGAAVVTSLGPDDEAGRVVRAVAAERGCTLDWIAADESETIEAGNVALAGAALARLGERGVRARSGEPVGPSLIDADVRAAARLVGRMERIDARIGGARVPLVLDGAHVPFNLARVLRDLRRTSDLAGPAVAVVALAADKDAEGFLRELARGVSHAVFTDVPFSHRGRPAHELLGIAASLGLAGEAEPDPARALARTLTIAAERGTWALATGSFYLVGALRSQARGGG